MPTAGGVDAIAEAADPEVPRWTRVPSPYTRANAEQFVEKAERVVGCRDRADLGRPRRRPLGRHARVARLERGESAEIGFWLAKPARGNGYLIEAAREVLDFAFEPSGLDLQAHRVARGRRQRGLGARRTPPRIPLRGSRAQGTLGPRASVTTAGSRRFSRRTTGRRSPGRCSRTDPESAAHGRMTSCLRCPRCRDSSTSCGRA